MNVKSIKSDIDTTLSIFGIFCISALSVHLIKNEKIYRYICIHDSIVVFGHNAYKPVAFKFYFL